MDGSKKNIETLPNELEAHMNETSTKIPKITDQAWTDYVLSHLDKDEIYEGHPTTDGLRRVGDLLLGDLDIRNTLLQCPSAQNGMVAVAESNVRTIPDVDGIYREVTEVSDAHEGNTKYPYSNHLSATAATKAEGRALRKLLRLKKIVTAEEMGAEAVVTSKTMNDSQYTMLMHMGQKFDINIWTYLINQAVKVYPDKQFKTLKEFPHEFISEIIGGLNKFQQKDKEGNINQVPQEFKGFDPQVKELWV